MPTFPSFAQRQQRLFVTLQERKQYVQEAPPYPQICKLVVHFSVCPGKISPRGVSVSGWWSADDRQELTRVLLPFSPRALSVVTGFWQCNFTQDGNTKD